MEKISSVSPIPVEVSQRAQEAQLGNLMQVFPTDVESVRFSLLMENFLLILCCVIFLGSIVLSLLSYWPTYMWSFPVLWLLLLAGFVGNLKNSWIWRQGAKCFVYFYENGFIATLNLQGKLHLDVVSWECIATIWPAWGKGCLVVYEKATGNSALIRIQKATKEYDLLTVNIQIQTMRVKLPKYIKDIEQGKECFFGILRGWDGNKAIVEQGFHVTQQGLQYKNQFLSWNDIAFVGIEGKRLIVMCRSNLASPWIRVSVHSIANVDILVKLSLYMLKL